MNKLPPLISTLILPLIGLSLLLCFSARPRLGPSALLCSDNSELRQIKPAVYNKTRLILLWEQYSNYEQCRRRLRQARTMRDEMLWQRRMRASVGFYNQVSDDTDPSAFARSPLPRHLSSL